ncbi:GH92 family glycosyl hydrolase [Cellulomonas sp. HZM]|uniref:GH92 family glycosyl hydrolase n=1 Tax=Cellulomonas sp. HZM TaxID=1454010 RepID=UPI0009E032AD|nr:GH92 family glycosyl hydrolase [Cellulomonas sp. HZM]
MTRSLLASGVCLALAGTALSAATTPAGAADTPTTPAFTSSFETSDPSPLASSPYSPPVNITGSQFGPGSLLGSVAAVTASGENAPNEVATAAADATSSTKWLVRTNTAWLQYKLTGAKTVKAYSITSANDSEARDPKAWQVLGSNDGTTWSVVDTQSDIDFPSRFQTQTFQAATPGSYLYYRLNITANSGDSLIQLADWEILDGTDTPPTASPMVTGVGGGPVSGPTIKSTVGFTGLKALRYGGSQTADGDAHSTDVLYDGLDLAVTDGMELAYKVFPVLDESNLTYPATYVAVDLELSDGTTTTLMSDANLSDQYGFGADAASQGREKALYGNQWNSVRVDLSSLAGKHVTKVLLSYHNPAGKKGTSFSGWVDDVALRQAATVDGSSLTNWVDTRRGTNANSSFSRGNNIPASAVPNGFNFYTPMTDAGSQSWLYNYASGNNGDNRPTLNGIGISHEPSPWMGDRDQLAVMPSITTASTPSADLTARKLPFSHDNEIARPDLYQVAFDNGIVAKVAPSDHSAVYSFAYPASANLGTVILDQVQGTSSIIYSGNTVSGWVEGGSGLSVGASRMYFRAEFSATPTRGVTTAGRTTGLAVQFDTTTTKTVEMRIATSFISLDQAKKNLDEEVTGKSFTDVQQTAAGLWNDRLKVIDVPDATQAQRQTLYANLYRLNLYPNSQFEHTGKGSADGYQYASPVSAKTGSATATDTNAKVVDGKIYVNNGFWDTYRTVWPAYSFLYPDVAKELVDGFVQQYRDGGWIARWSSPGYADLMTGTSSDASFAEAYVSGALSTDLALEAFDAATKNATVLPTSSNVGRKGLDTSPFLGYTSTATGESVSWGLEGYINDYAIGEMAAKLAADPQTPANRVEDLKEQSAYLLKRAEDYVNMFDPSVGFFQGKTAAGDFAKSASTYDPTSWGGDYTETNGWNFAFHTPYDVAGLSALYGGTDGLVDKLDEFFGTQEKGTYGIHEAKEARDVRMGQFGMSNQVSHHIPYIYAAAGDPAGTQKTVREVLQRLFVGSEIGQGYPGDEDNGEMSSWYLFSSLGFYPLSLASGQYTVGSPLFDKVVVDRGAHGKLTIDAPGNSKKNVYVSSLKVDGQAVDVPTIEQSAILDGNHTITFGMTDQPTTWGTGHTTAQQRTPYVDAAKPDYGTVAASDDTDLSLLVDDNSRTSVTLPATKTDVTWTSTSGPVAVASYTLTNAAAGADGTPSSAPKAWKLQASNDGEAWTTLDERSDEAFTWATQTRAFTVADPALYTRYRIVIDETSTGAPAKLAEVELLDDTLQQSSDLEIYPSATIKAKAGATVSSVLATAKGGTNDLSDYTATVDFLDGNGAQQGTVARSKLGGVQVTAPHTFDAPGVYTVRVTITAVVDDEPATVSGLTTISVTRDQTLTGAFNVACLSEAGVAADCDGNGYSLNKSELAAAGFEQGKAIGVTGSVSFTPPVVASGKPDNVTALGQKIRLDLGEGATQISVIGFANEKTQTGTATITYSDGSTQALPLSFGDWVGAASNPVSGTSVLAKVVNRQKGTSPKADNLTTAIFATTPATLKSGVTAEWITLPDLKNTVKQGQMHIFGFASDGVRTETAALSATGLDVEDQLSGTPAKLDLAKVSGGQPTEAGYSATISWGDETPVEKVAVDGKVVSGTHAWAAPGTYTVTVTVDDGVSSTSTTTKVTVESSVYDTAISVAPSTVAPGASITVAGTGFAKGEQVVVELASSPKVTRTVTASSTGTITATVVVPKPSLDGTYPITALGARSNTVAETSVSVVNPLVTTKLSIAASASSAKVGSPVTLTATISPSGTGAVEFLDGRTSLGLVSVAAGKATLVVDDLSVGTHTIHATYAGDAGHKPATSGNVVVKVERTTPGVSAPKLSRTSKVYGASTTVTLSTTVKGLTSGTVTFKNGSTVLGHAVIGRMGSGYGASVQLARKLPAGTYSKITASVAQTATTSAVTSAKATKSLKVSKAAPSSVKVSGKAFKKSSKPNVSVTVGKLTNGSYAVGKVKVYVNGKAVKTVSLKSSAHGKVSVTLPKASKTIKVKATFVPSDTKNVSSKSSKTVKVSVKK